MIRLSASLRFSAIVLIAAAATAAEPLVWKWAEGDTARYQLTQTMEISVDAGAAGQIATSRREDKVFVWTVQAVDADAVTLQRATERVVLATEGPMGQSFTFDSSDENPPAGMAAMLAPMFEAIIANPTEMTMSPTGDIGEVAMPDELIDALKRLPGGGVSEEAFIQSTKQGSVAFPAETLEVGDEWNRESQVDIPPVGPMKVTTTYRYNGPKDVEGRACESFTPSVAMEALDAADEFEISIENKGGDGEILFDRESGRLVRSRVDQSLMVRLKVDGQDTVSTFDQSTQMHELAAGETPDFGQQEAATTAVE